MRIAKIKNKYLFKSDNPEGVHYYAVYQDKKTWEIRAIGLTHLYIKDLRRDYQVKRGNLMVEKFQEFKTPSGVKNSYFSRAANGKKINLKDREVQVYNRYLSKKQAERIKKFAKRKESP